MGFLFCLDVWGETSVQVAGNVFVGTLSGQLDADTARGMSAVRRGSESLTQCQNKKSMASLCFLSGEIGGTKTSAEGLFPLPICVIMVVA